MVFDRSVQVFESLIKFAEARVNTSECQVWHITPLGSRLQPLKFSQGFRSPPRQRERTSQIPAGVNGAGRSSTHRAKFRYRRLAFPADKMESSQ